MPSEYVARAPSERGDVLLRRRHSDGALELRVNGVFVMDTQQTGTERLLAEMTLEALPAGGRLVVLVGGLGLGFTLSAVLRDERVAKVIVAEIEPSLVAWHEQGIVAGSDIGDRRVEVAIGDVRDVVGGLAPDSIDLLLLDVDNGPGCLVYSSNAGVYGVEFLLACRQALRGGGGMLAIWSADPSPALSTAVGAVFGKCEEHALPVRLGRRDTTYHLFRATR